MAADLAPADVALRSRPMRFGTVALMVLAGVLAAIAASVVPDGLPYDEPAHWSNVLFFLDRGRLPILGEDAVEYQGQQTPLYYVAAAAVAGLTERSLAAARLLNVVGFVAITGLTAMITAFVVGRRTVVVLAATAFIALNPMLAVMSGSVQNDTWALVWGLLAILLALRPVRGPRWLRGAAVGLVASLAILTKVSMAPLLIGVVIACLIRRRVIEALTATAVAVLATGWWFVRNLVLYGDFTGQSAVHLTGAVFDTAPAGAPDLALRVLTYLTLPTEYLRNAIEAPAWVDVSAILVGAVLASGLVLLAVREWRRFERWGLLVVVLVALASVAAWLVQSLFGWPVAFRTAYAALALFALAAGAATQIARVRSVAVGVAVLTAAAQLAAGAWVLSAVIALDGASLL